MIIYKAINKTNDKIYIGQTTKSLEDRISAHIKIANSSFGGYYFHRSIKKYGVNNFTWKILEYCDTKEELNEMEFHYIKQYNSMAPNGYNLTLGGEGFFGRKHSNITKELISEKLKIYFETHNNPMFGKTHPIEVRQYISSILKGKMSGENNPFYGKKHTDNSKRKMSVSSLNSDIHVNRGKPLSKEWRKKISKSNKGKKRSSECRANISRSKKGKFVGKNNTCSKKFVITTPDGYCFYVVGLAYFSKIYKNGLLDSRLLSAVATGKRNHHKGYKCRYFDKTINFDLKEYLIGETKNG